MDKFLIPNTQYDLQLPVAIVGLGLSNKSTEKLLRFWGVPQEKIIFFDDKVKEYNSCQVINDAGDLMLSAPKTLLVSPGYPLRSQWIQEAMNLGVKIESELSLASLLLTQEKVIGVTGSLGKSTTTSLVSVAIDAAQKTNYVGGNLGYPLADYILDVLSAKRQRAEYVVLELSSFQLENLGALKLVESIMTYFCPNHLERYEGLEDYYSVKASLVPRTLGRVFVNSHSEDLKNFFDHNKSPKIVLSDLGSQHYFSDTDWKQKKLVGTHNHENLLIVAKLCDALGIWNDEVKKALLNFRGLSHRMEMVSDHGPVFVNDSKSTAMVSVLSAIQSILNEAKFSDRKRVLWVLLGGRDKKLPWEDLKDLSKIDEDFIKFVFFGESRDLAQAKSGLKGPTFETLQLCMQKLPEYVRVEDWVLLSPGGTSLDEFKNFEDRGFWFSEWAKKWR